MKTILLLLLTLFASSASVSKPANISQNENQPLSSEQNRINKGSFYDESVSCTESEKVIISTTGLFQVISTTN